MMIIRVDHDDDDDDDGDVYVRTCSKVAMIDSLPYQTVKKGLYDRSLIPPGESSEEAIDPHPNLRPDRSIRVPHFLPLLPYC